MVFCTDHVPGAYVPSTLAQIPHLPGNMEQCRSWMAGGGGGEELGGARQGLAAFLGEEGAVVSAHVLLLVKGTTPGPGLADAHIEDMAQRVAPVKWRVCADAELSQAPAGTCRCSPLPVICRNSVFSFPSFQEHQVSQLLSSYTCSSSLNLVPHFCISSINVTDCSLLFSSAAKWVCSHSWAQWVAHQMLKCLQRKKKLSIDEAWGKWRQWISAMLFLYLSACKVYNFWSAVCPICEFICLGVAGDK